MIKSNITPRFGRQYIRYLISYIMILLIPLVILTYFYSSRFMKKFYKEIYETVDLELMQLGTQIENEWSSMQNITVQLTIAGTIQDAVLAENPLALESVITDLSCLRIANNFIKDVALVLEDQDYVITSFTTCQKDYYFNRIFQIPDQNENQLKELLLSASAPVCLPSQEILNLQLGANATPTILFSFPLFTDYQKQEGSVLFFIEDSAVQKLLNQKLQSYQAQLYILDDTGAIITSYGPNPDAFYSDSREYIIRTYQSDVNSWTYQAWLPNRQATFSQVSDIMRDFMLTIVIILLIGGFTIYWLQKVNYKPIRELMDKAKKLSSEENTVNELTSISNALDFLSTQNTSLSTRLENSLAAVKNERLFRLISGRYESREDFNLDCSELNLHLPNEYFAVSILMLHQPVSNLEVLALEMKKLLEAPYFYYYLHTFHPDQIVLLANLPEASTPFSKNLQRIQEYLLKHNGLLITIGIGTTVNSAEKIGHSYVEAASSLDYRFVKGNGTLIRFQEITGSFQTPVIYPHQEFEGLYNALLAQKDEAIRSSIQNIIQFMEQNRLPLYLARSICFDLIHMVNEHYRIQKDTISGSPLELTGIETSQEIIQMLRGWSEQLGSFGTPPNKKVTISEVMSYLNANCLNCDFSVYEAAEHFEMTLPAFSKFFKNHVGQNVMDYIISLRIQKAKELLSGTTLPLKEISEQVGYYNVSSFTRRFKLTQGITPGEYRKLHRQEA